MSRASAQSGLMLPAVLALLAVLSVLVAVTLRLGNLQFRQTAASIHGAQAFRAAEAGAYWALARIDAAQGCPATEPTVMDLDGAGYPGIQVRVSCRRFIHVDAGQQIQRFEVHSIADYGRSGLPDHVRRQIKVTYIR